MQTQNPWLHTMANFRRFFSTERLAEEKQAREVAIKIRDLLYQQSVEGSRVCDVNLYIGDTVVKAHWCVLVSCPYFQALYDSGLNESVTGDVKLTYGDVDAMKAAIKFLYTGRMELSMDNVQHVLEVADYLMMEGLKAWCAQFLEDTRLHLGNCAQVMLMASQYNMDTVYKEAFHFVSGHLPELLQGDQLLDMTKDSVLSFFQDPTLSYTKREDFFNFLVRWTARDHQNRAEHFPELFKGLNFLLVTEGFLKDTVLCHPLVQQSEDCLLHLQEARNRGSADFTPCGSGVMLDVVILGGGARERFEVCGKKGLEWCVTSSTKLQAYFPCDGRSAKLPDLPYGIWKPLMTLTGDGKLLVTDSVQTGQSERTNEILSYSFQENRWSLIKFSCPSENYDIEFHSLHSCNGRLFVVASSKCQKKTSRRKKAAQSSKEKRNSEKEGDGPFHHVQLLELINTPKSSSFKVKKGIFQRSVDSEIRVACMQRRDRTTLDGDFIYVKGTHCFDYTAPAPGAHQTKLFVYSVKTDSCKEVQRKLTGKSLALGLPEGLVSCAMGTPRGELFSQKDGKVISSRDFAIPHPSYKAARRRVAYTSVDEQLYLFGGNPNTGWTQQSVAKFCFSARTWTFLGYIPEPVLDAGIARGRIPSDMLRCHAECPHCRYKGKSGPTYDDAIMSLILKKVNNLAEMDSEYDSEDSVDSFVSDSSSYIPPWLV